jgi:hypothetical protein
MITMILLVQHLAEAASEDEARPKVTGGPSITSIMRWPGTISFCPYHCDQPRLKLTQIEKSGLRGKRGRIPGSRGDPGFNKNLGS